MKRGPWKRIRSARTIGARQVAEGGQMIDFLPWKTQQEIRRLLGVSHPDDPGNASRR
jgi:hypothetical protein